MHNQIMKLSQQCFKSRNKGNSWHFYRWSTTERGRFIDKTPTWSRPCFNGYAKVILGDSSIRAFARKNKKLQGVSISAFGGMDLLEGICMLKAGKLSKDCDLTKYRIRNRFQNGRDEFPIIRFCKHCYTECMNEFNGECYIILGLNNSLKAEMEPFANEYGRNLQDVDGMFELLDDTLKKVLPKATIKLAPVLDVENDAWNRSELKQKIFKEFNANIMKRNHLQQADPRF